MANQDPNSGNVNRPENKLSFRCADVGDKSCQWETKGKSEEEVMRSVEQHGRETHNLKMDDNMREKVRGAIRNDERKSA